MTLRLLILTTLTLLMYLESQAQWDFGAYLGMSRTQLQGDSPKDFSYRPGYLPEFGGIINLYFKDDARVSFQPGYGFNRPVLAYRDRELDEKRDSINLNLDYIKLPIFLDVISDNEKWHFLVGADIQIALSQQGDAIGSNETFDLSDELLDVNPVVIFGLGRRFGIGNSILSVDLRFGQGILNISDKPDDKTSLVPRIKTSSFALMVLYEFRSQHK